jgi:hypothetical protein
LDSALCQKVCHVADPFYRHKVFIEIGCSIRVFVSKEIAGPAQDAEELIEAVPIRPVLREVTQMPFPDQGCVVAVTFQE